MKKILWLCNTIFSETKITGTGSWLQPLAEKLQESGEVQIINITSGKTDTVIRQDFGSIQQWIIPIRPGKGYGQIASKTTCTEIAQIEEKVAPDLVHIWGTEQIWASVYQQGFIKTKALLDIQGLLFSYTDYYYGGLSFSDILHCIHLKEMMMPWRTLWNKKRIFRKRGLTELACLEDISCISYQSEWVKNQLVDINPTARYFPTKIMLRNMFYDCAPWKYTPCGNKPVIFSFCSAAVPYKGMHTLLKALSILKQKYPHITLNLAGRINVGNKLLDGYSIFLHKLIKRYNLEDNVHYTGPLNEAQIIGHLQKSNVCVVPSYIETYCLAFAESMIVGVPTVASFAGAMPELAVHEREALFYNSMDYKTCAAHISTLIENKEYAEFISKNGLSRRKKQNDINTVVQTQLNIYNSIIQTERLCPNQ